jgi:hypothetical protein
VYNGGGWLDKYTLTIELVGIACIFNFFIKWDNALFKVNNYCPIQDHKSTMSYCVDWVILRTLLILLDKCASFPGCWL